MREAKEPELKLFGRKIVLPENGGADGGDEEKEAEAEAEGKRLQEEEEQKLCDSETQESDHNKSAGEELPNTDETSESDEDPKTPSRDEDGLPENHPKAEETEATNGQQKPLKKPDKILPCPRCNSMDTKFCYYNNYNVNQPRHFCKSCQRYWTAGGTMRNVPVGAGRRKNKNSASHCRHITISEALQAARIDAPNGFHHPAFKPNGTVLSFGPDSPLCESVASALNLQDKRIPNGVRNGYNKVNLGSPVGENGVDPLIRSSINTMNPMAADRVKNGIQPPAMQNINGFPSCIPGAPWPYPWNSALPIPAIYPPGYPIPFYPAPYGTCTVPNAWNVPWLSTPSPTNQKPTGSGSGSGPNSPLGKHSRNGELLTANTSESNENSESPIVVPKTLRIDDPEEAAKSSIWETLGIKYVSVRREELFKALQPKGDGKKLAATNSPVLQANPAALSRSISFQEGV